MLAALLWLVALILAAALALALTPVRLSLRAETGPRPRLRVGAAPLGGIVPQILLFDSARKRPEKPKPKPAEAPARPKAGLGTRARRGTKPAGTGARLGRELPRLVAGLLGQVRFEHLRVDADYGLADPADTGVLCGLIAPFAYGLPARPGVSIALRPDFGQVVLAGELDAGVRITPAALLPPALRFAWAVWGPVRGPGR